jgi:phage shock protein A
LDEGADALAKLLIDKKEQNQASLLEATTDLDLAEQDLKDSIAVLGEVHIEIEKLKAEKITQISKLKNAEARRELKAALEGLSTSADADALESIRNRVKTVTAGVELDRQMKDSSPEEQLRKLREKSSKGEIDAKLAQLKAERAARKQAS